MNIKLTILSAAVAYCSAIKAIDLNNDIPAESTLGSRLLSKARRVNQQQEVDYTWLNKYSIRFHSCHTIHSFGGEMEGGGGEEGSNPIGNQHLVNFKLCPSDDDCSKCKYGGQYVVELREFMEVYLQTKQELEQAQCEAVEEYCNCNYYYGDDEKCMAKCYSDAGLDFCGDDEFNVEEFIECAEAEFSNNEYYASTYFIGPVCSSNGSAIHLNLFKDERCTVATDNSAYSKYNYDMYGNAATLPYSSKSLVDSECISCKEVDENAYYQQNNNYYQAEDPIELCLQVYMQSAKCENKMKTSYPDTGSCTYINNILPALEHVNQSGGSGTYSNGATALAWIFFITTICAGAGMYHFYVISLRKTVALQGNGGIV